MNRFVLTIFAILMATYLVEAEREKRNLGDTAAALYSSAFSAVLPESTKEACRGLGWVDGPNNGRKRRDYSDMLRILGGDGDQRRKRGFFDNFVPTALAHAVGVGHKEVFPESMQESFCTNVGMVRPAPNAGPQVVVVQAPQQPYQTVSGYYTK